MVVVQIDVRALRRFVLGLLAVAAAAWWAIAAVGADAQETAPLGRYAFVARADNPVDALAASAMAGQLGAPVYLTNTDALGQDTRDALVAYGPDVVVLAGGFAALSEAVETQVAEALPSATVRRLSGAGRTQTAVALNGLAGELGIGRPVLTDATVSGDVTLDGTLVVGDTDVTGAIGALDARVAALESQATDFAQLAITASQQLAAAEARIAELEQTLAGVTRENGLLTFSGMNVRIVNGEGTTNTTNGLGNLIIGYGEDHTDGADYDGYSGDGAADDRTGSHNLVIGVDHSYESSGGIVAGANNHVTGLFSSVTGGVSNLASGGFAAVVAGTGNNAMGDGASVTGGVSNIASGFSAVVTGGNDNTADGAYTVVAGGSMNTATGTYATVSGGGSNTASGELASTSGGVGNTASGRGSSVSGGATNVSSGHATSIPGGKDETEADDHNTKIGGAATYPDG